MHRLVVILILVFSGFDAAACTIPVFRYALDRWQGKTGENEVESSVYEEIASRILSGDSAVWIQVDSGDTEKDDEVFDRISKRLKFFESVAELPDIDPDDPSSQLGPGPDLALRFSTLRIRRDDPIVPLLSGPEAELLPGDDAWIFPVFGRGRVLGAWPGGVMDEEGIDEVCHYLTGACSCQVKAQNPGWDLVMNVDWEERLFEADRLAVAASLDEPVEPAPKDAEDPEVEELRTDVSSVTVPPDAAPRWFWLPLAALLFGCGVFLLFRKKQSPS